ncbi:MAG: hypothetical protein KDK27_20930, partial [Leptospiraceae bacterium]|nr:hypothetical protein [Leptospiraceae bacterium]
MKIVLKMNIRDAAPYQYDLSVFPNHKQNLETAPVAIERFYGMAIELTARRRNFRLPHANPTPADFLLCYMRTTVLH